MASSVVRLIRLIPKLSNLVSTAKDTTEIISRIVQGERPGPAASVDETTRLSQIERALTLQAKLNEQLASQLELVQTALLSLRWTIRFCLLLCYALLAAVLVSLLYWFG
ncbi:MAG: hypothetical protein ACE5HK_04120 [Candidatus Methylomirabilales bacterium]